jgi:hypothetical protein
MKVGGGGCGWEADGCRELLLMHPGPPLRPVRVLMLEGCSPALPATAAQVPMRVALFNCFHTIASRSIKRCKAGVIQLISLTKLL